MRYQKKIITEGLLIFSPFLFGFLYRWVGYWLGIPIGTEQELIRLLLLPNTEALWIPATMCRIIFLLLTAMAVTMTLERMMMAWGWCQAIFLALFYSFLLLFWSLKEFGIIFCFTIISLVQSFVVVWISKRRNPQH